jgi:hypothetical protein
LSTVVKGIPYACLTPNTTGSQINRVANVIFVSGCPAAEFALEPAVLCHIPEFFLVTKVKEIARQNTQVLTMPFFFTRPFILHLFFCHISISPYLDVLRFCFFIILPAKSDIEK